MMPKYVEAAPDGTIVGIIAVDKGKPSQEFRSPDPLPAEVGLYLVDETEHINPKVHLFDRKTRKVRPMTPVEIEARKRAQG